LLNKPSFVIVARSYDGENWTEKTVPVAATILKIKYINNKFYMLAGKYLLISLDGLSWTQLTSPVNSYLYDISYGNNMYVIVGANGNVLTSSDGISWTSNLAIPSTSRTVCYGNGLFV
jgi:hypothetical protein